MSKASRTSSSSGSSTEVKDTNSPEFRRQMIVRMECSPRARRIVRTRLASLLSNCSVAKAVTFASVDWTCLTEHLSSTLSRICPASPPRNCGWDGLAKPRRGDENCSDQPRPIKSVLIPHDTLVNCRPYDQINGNVQLAARYPDRFREYEGAHKAGHHSAADNRKRPRRSHSRTAGPFAGK